MHIYLIIYGKGVNAIAEDLKVSKEKAQEIKDAVLKAFPDLANYLENVIKFLKDKGYVENYFGVRRRLPEIYLPPYEFEFDDKFDKNSRDYYEKSYLNKLNNTFGWNKKNEIIAEAKSYGIKIIQNSEKIAEAIRRAYNAPVQSTASYITKQAMINIDTNERLKELDVHLEFSIHD